MASTSADAHKLIALSLGKIQAARGQRGGVNLHKNLLVAGVILKARTIYMMGVSNRAPSYQEPDLEADNEESDDEEEELLEDAPSSPVSDSSLPTPVSETDQTPEIQASKTSIDSDSECQDCDKENDSSRANKKITKASSEKFHVDKEQRESVLAGSEMDSDSACGRCTKRRFSEDSESLNTKRARVSPSDSTDSSLTPVTTKTDSSTQCQPEPMQTDSAQISSLVHRFNSGLTGFLSCNGNSQNQDNNNTSSTDSSNSSDCSLQSTTLNKDSHTVSCSTQIKEAFETLTRPVALALSV